MWTEGQKGSFFTLDDEFIEKYMPLTYKYQDHKFFEETKLAGKMIAMPRNAEEPENKMQVMRTVRLQWTFTQKPSIISPKSFLPSSMVH